MQQGKLTGLQGLCQSDQGKNSFPTLNLVTITPLRISTRHTGQIYKRRFSEPSHSTSWHYLVCYLKLCLMWYFTGRHKAKKKGVGQGGRVWWIQGEKRSMRGLVSRGGVRGGLFSGARERRKLLVGKEGQTVKTEKSSEWLGFCRCSLGWINPL